MKVAQIIARPLSSIPPTTSMLNAARVMVDQNLGLLVVCDPQDEGKLLGVVSERDIMKAMASGREMETSVDEICTKKVVTVTADSEVAEAAKAINKNRIRHVVVVDRVGRPIGVVSIRDLVGERATLKAIVQSHEKEIFVGGD